MMLKHLDSVIFFDSKGQHEFLGIVVACEKDYFWLLVPKMKTVYIGHPDKVYTRDGKKYFDVFDHQYSLNKIFGKSLRPDVEAGVFWYAKDPKQLAENLKMLKLRYSL